TWVGISGEIGRLIGFVAAAVAGYFSVGPWQDLAARLVRAEAATHWRGVVVVLGVIVTVVVVASVVRWLVKRCIRLVIHQPVDALLGLLFGLLRGALIAVFFFFLASYVAFGAAAQYLFETSWIGQASLPSVGLLRDTIGEPHLPMLDAWRESLTPQNENSSQDIQEETQDETP
ncbi:MAG: CvpA family protein, partial [Kiritimatiellaeota bacterium]|nr:CvpA family protein [Kiritimatiellota bacterium]